MPDRVDAATRSRIMASIHSTDTEPELAVRKALHARGFRDRVHVKALPGSPGIVVRRLGPVIFANGCFWHKHDCALFQRHASRPVFWEEKRRRNRERAARVREALCGAARRCLVWEWSIRGPERREFEQVIDSISAWLTGTGTEQEIRGNAATRPDG